MTIEKLLRPRSIAVVGASAREGSFGLDLLRTVQHENAATIYPVNPKATEIEGFRAYPNLGAVPTVPDCALLAVGDASILGAMTAVAEAGVKAAVIYGRITGESDKGIKATEIVAGIAREAGIKLCGGNCMGFVNFTDRIQAASSPFNPFPKAGPVGLISHSGSSWSGLIGNGRGLNFNYAVSAGQELVTTSAEYLEFMLAQPQTRAVACVMETIRDPERFLAALEVADRKDIPVVVLKLGISDAAKDFALSHSGALSGSNATYDAIFSRYNVVRVETLDELIDTTELLCSPRKPTAAGIAVATDSGGERQLITDLASRVDLTFAKLSETTNEELAQFLDKDVAPSNPLDYWGDGGDVIASCLKALAADANVGAVVLASNMINGRGFAKTCADAVESVFAATEKPVIVLGNVSTGMSIEQTARLRKLGVPILMGTDRAVKSLKRYLDYSFRHRVADRTAPSIPGAAKAKWEARLASAPGLARSSAEGFELLADFDISVAPWAMIETVEDIGAFAAQHGFPLVMKIDDPAMPHKTEHQAVILNIRSAAEAATALETLRSRHPGRPIMLQSQTNGVELLIGMTADPQFGPVVTFGIGGIFVEVFKDVVSLIPPFSPEEVHARLRSLRGAALLEGARGKPKADVAAAAIQIARFGTMCSALGPAIREIEINPVIVGQTGALAVDCLLSPA